MSNLYDEKTFETEIIRIADQVFQPYGERRVNFLYNEKERDAVYDTEMLVHCVEITTSRRKEKASYDLEKIQELVQFYNEKYKGQKAVRGWLITLGSLTPEQADVLKRYPSYIIHETYHQFLSRLIDSQEYLRLRSHHKFGSVQTLEGLSSPKSQDIFVPSTLDRVGKRSAPVNISQLTRWIRNRTKYRFLIEGDFGSGKSMHMKRIFEDLSKDHISGRQSRFPIYLNLREVAELDGPEEALRRHASRIGMQSLGEKLIGAWKADYTYLLIDGFDEVAPRITASDAKRIRDIRHQALLVVRRFIKDSPQHTPIVLAGRSNFFSSSQEMHDALGVSDAWERLQVQDFDDHQVIQLQKKFGVEFKLPDWLPRRPLLISYMIAHDRAHDLLGVAEMDSAHGWLFLLDKFTQREVDQIDTLPLVQSDLLELYGELALRARKRGSKIGPISANDLVMSFKHLFGDEPSGVSLGQLMRLPGLISSGQPSLDIAMDGDNNQSFDAKNFISFELVEVSSSKYLASYLKDFKTHKIENFVGIKSTLNECGITTIKSEIEKHNENINISEQISFINSKQEDSFAQIDLIQFLISEGISYASKGIKISNIELDELNLMELNGSYQRIEFNNCYFSKVIIDINTGFAQFPKFTDCLIELVSTNGSNPVASTVFGSCHVEREDVAEFTTNAYLNIQASKETKILCSVLNKIYRQSGAGRMEKALKSGMPDHQIPVVEYIVESLHKKKIITLQKVESDNRWHAVPAYIAQVEEFLRESTDRKAHLLLNS